MSSPVPTSPPTSVAATTDRPTFGWGSSVLAYAVFAWVTCFLGLGWIGLINMEGMVVDGAHHMLEEGDWAVPHVYDEVYTFKPALAYWLSAVPQALLDNPSAGMLRSPFALASALAGLVVLILIGRAVTPRAGLFAAMGTVGSVLFVEKVRVAEFDSPLAAGVAVAVAAACCNLARNRDSAGLWVLGYLGLAAAFLAKGGPALMAYGPGLLLAALLCRRWWRLFGWRHLLGSVVFVVAVGGYLWWAVETSGTVVFDQPRGEAQWRTASWNAESMLRSALSPAMIFVVLLPFSLVLLRGRSALRELTGRPRKVAIASLGFLAGGILCFAAVATHETRYYLPLAPALAIAAGVLLEHLISASKTPSPRWFSNTVRTILVVSALFIFAATIYIRSVGGIPALVAVVALFALGWLGEHGVDSEARGWRRSLNPIRRTPQLVRALVAISLIVAIGQAAALALHRGKPRDLTEVAAIFDRLLPKDAPLWVHGPSDLAGRHSSLYYYLDREVRTFEEGAEVPPGSYFLVTEVLGPPANSEGAEQLISLPHPHWTFSLYRKP